MKSISVAVRIWAKTVVLNAILFGIWGMLTRDIMNMLGSVLLLIGGIITTVPLLMVIAPLIKVSNSLPYNIPAKTSWLTFFLMLLIIVIYEWASLIIDDTLFKTGSMVSVLLGTTIMGLVIAVLTTRRSLNKLYTQS
jgi:hypothetical protein